MSYVHMSLDDAEDQAPQFGLESQEARFYRKAVGATGIGFATYKVKPDGQFEFGHRHGTAEEVYLVLSGSGKLRVGDDVLDIAARDAVYVEPQEWRVWQAGPDGMELLAFGSHAEAEGENEMDKEFRIS